MKKIIIAGATGLIGSNLVNKLSDFGYSVTVISRNTTDSKLKLPEANVYINWESQEHIIRELDGSSCVINLAGVSLAGGRWTDSYKEQIIESRITATKKIVSAISECNIKPDLINVSAIGFYGNRSDEFLDESSIKGNDFLTEVCSMWEEEALKAENFTRVVIPRLGIVLDKSGGALEKLVMQFNFLTGGPLGTGKQWMSWIHIEDVTEIFNWLIDNREITGYINCVSPNPVTMKEFARTLGRVMRRPSFFLVPEFVLKMILGEKAIMVLNSQRVIPKKIIESGYVFKYSSLEKALLNILK